MRKKDQTERSRGYEDLVLDLSQDRMELMETIREMVKMEFDLRVSQGGFSQISGQPQANPVKQKRSLVPGCLQKAKRKKSR